MKYNVRNIICLLMVINNAAGADVITRLMYDTMSQLVGESKYPDNW